jgi:hypothetical protein
MNALQIVLIAAVVIFLIGRRFVGAPVGSRTLALPIVLTAWGIEELSKQHTIGVGALALLAVEVLIGVAAGAARGMTIKLYPRDGHLWQRYTVVTLGVWIAMIAVRLGFLAAGRAMGVTLSETTAVMVTFGISMVIESLVVSSRAAATGTPIAPRRSRRTVGARY